MCRQRQGPALGRGPRYVSFYVVSCQSRAVVSPAPSLRRQREPAGQQFVGGGVDHSVQQRGGASQALAGRGQAGVEIEAPIDLDLDRMDMLVGPAVARQDIAAGIRRAERRAMARGDDFAFQAMNLSSARAAAELPVGWRCEVELERRNFAHGLGLTGRIR